MANRKACYGSNKAFAADMKKMVNNPLLRFIYFCFKNKVRNEKFSFSLHSMLSV